MRTSLLALCLAASFGFAALPAASAQEFSSDASITEHHWGGGHNRGRRGGRGRGYHHDGGYVDSGYYGGSYCY